MLRNCLCCLFIAVLSHQIVLANDEFDISGWNETIVSVRDFEDYRVFFGDIAQWRLREQGQVSRAQLDAWQLPKSASAKYQVYGNKGAESGFIRLLQFEGVEQRYIRQDSQSWDTGGIFDINVRVTDMDKTADQLRRLGWKSRAPVTRFVFGPYDVKEWIVASPDGLELALIARIAPELKGWPNLKSVSRTFNSTQVVKDFDAAIKFYTEVLGFDMVQQEHGYLSKEDGPNSLGFPYNLQTVNPRKIFILSPTGKNDGSVEVLKILGLDGADHSGHANLPNLGIAALRFPVKNIDALQDHLKQSPVDWVHDLREIDDARSLTIKSPEGAWLEFYETN